MREFLFFGLRKLGLRLREEANFGLILSFVLGSICSSGNEGRREGKRKLCFEGFKKIKVWNSCMETVIMEISHLMYGKSHKFLCLGLCYEKSDFFPYMYFGLAYV